MRICHLDGPPKGPLDKMMFESHCGQSDVVNFPMRRTYVCFKLDGIRAGRIGRQMAIRMVPQIGELLNDVSR